MYWSKLIVKRRGKMRKLQIIVLLILGGWLMPNMAIAQFTETKELTKQFAVSPETKIEISNKYGKIEINTWEQDSVVIDIKIRVEEKNLSKLEDAIRGIDFDITDSQHYLIVRTDVEKNKSLLSKEFTRFVESVLKSDGNIQVDFTVWMPATNELKVENKFGDVYIDDYLGKVDINLSNGNLKAHDFEGELNLVLSFADATINTINKGYLDCNFSELHVEDAESIRINSKSTEFEFQKVTDLNAESRRDKFRIQEIDAMDATCSFTTIRINKLTDRMNLRSDYGDLDIEKTALDFNVISIESRATDLNLYFDETSKFDFDITSSKTELDYCTAIEIDNEETLDEKERTLKQTGSFGEKNTNTPKLIINATSGKISIKSN